MAETDRDDLDALAGEYVLGTLGAECQIIEQCADGLVCRYGTCCRHTRAACTQDSDCCEAGDVCEFRNDLGRNACCREAGETCSVDQDCCGAMECRGELPQRCVVVE